MLTRALESCGATQEQIARHLGALRVYARMTGEGRDWAMRTGKTPRDSHVKTLSEEFVTAIDSLPWKDVAIAARFLLVRMAEAAGDGPLVIDEASVAAITRKLADEGRSASFIRQSLTFLRRFARHSGLGRSWAEATAASRVETSIDDLPERMRMSLESLVLPPSSLTLVRTAVRRLAGVCQQRGLETRLDHHSAEALEDALLNDGFSRKEVGKTLTLLRVYARATGEGLDWARRTGNTSLAQQRDNLPVSMRACLARMETTRRGVNGELPPIQTEKIVWTLHQFVGLLREANRPLEITEETVGIFVDSRRALGYAEATIRSCLRCLRKYAFSSGDGLDWAERTDRGLGIEVADLPKQMRSAIAGLGKSRKDGLPPLKPRHVQSIAYSLRWLVKVARAVGGPECLCNQSFSNLMDYLLRHGYSELAIANIRQFLLTYAKYTGEGKTWAQTAYKKDARRLPDMLAAPHWARLRRRAEALLQQGLRPYNLRLVDGFLKLPRRSGIVTEDAAAEYCERREHIARDVFATLKKLDPRSCDLHPLRVVLTESHRRASQQDPSRERASRCVVSVPVETLPNDIRNRLAALRAERVRGKPRYASNTVDSMERVLCQIVYSARSRGLPEELNDEAIESWLSDINGREIRSGYKKSLVRNIILYAKKTGACMNVIKNLKEDAYIYNRESLKETKKKFLYLAERPITIADVARASCSWGDLASRSQLDVRDDIWRRLWIGCAVLAILVVRPLRSCDMRRLVVGETIFWDGQRWNIELTASKNDEDLSGPLPEEITPYIDAAILQGALCTTQEEFEELYNRRVGLPLLSKPDGQPYSYCWLVRVCVEAFGHSTHIPRTLHITEAARRGSKAMDAARQRLGHRYPKSKEAYLMKKQETYLRAADKAVVSGVDEVRRQHAGNQSAPGRAEP